MNPWFTRDNPWFNFRNPRFGEETLGLWETLGFFKPVIYPWRTHDLPMTTHEKKHGYRAQNYLQIWFDFDGFLVTQLVILTLLAGWTWDPASWKSDPADWKSDLGDGKSDLCDRESKFLLFDTIYATLCFLVALCHIWWQWCIMHHSHPIPYILLASWFSVEPTPFWGFF